MNDYLTVKSDGFITYCDALIARFNSDKAQSFLLSLIGSPAHVQAASARFFSGEACLISSRNPFNEGGNNETFELTKCNGITHSIRAKKIGDTVNKVLISADHFPGAGKGSSESVNSAVIFGPDIETVKERAFLRLDGCTTMPLKPQWQEWLWEEVLQPEKLYSFGNSQLQEAWSICWQEDFEKLILEGIRQEYLS